MSFCFLAVSWELSPRFVLNFLARCRSFLVPFQGVVLGDYVFYRDNQDPSSVLLIFRALSDFGLASRFIFYRQFNQDLCGGDSCYIFKNSTNDEYDNEDRCGVSAGVLEFFEIASEAWFLCLSFDMYTSISNPFISSFKMR
jgi:hypothetical protein